MKTINITIKKDEVLNNISMNIYTIGERITDGDAKAVFVVQSGVDEGNRSLVIRELNNSWQNVLNMLAAYRTKRDRAIGPIKPKPEDVSNSYSNELTENDYQMTLYFPDNIPDDTGANMVEAIHSYMVSMGCFLWLKMARPDEAKIYFSEAEDSSKRIKSISCNRTRPTRIVGYGF